MLNFLTRLCHRSKYVYAGWIAEQEAGTPNDNGTQLHHYIMDQGKKEVGIGTVQSVVFSRTWVTWTMVATPRFISRMYCSNFHTSSSGWMKDVRDQECSVLVRILVIVTDSQARCVCLNKQNGEILKHWETRGSCRNRGSELNRKAAVPWLKAPGDILNRERRTKRRLS